MTRTTRRVLLGVVLLLALLGWLAVRTVQLRNHLVAAKAVLASVPTSLDGETGVRLGVQARAASADVRAAKRAADDPVFWLAAHVPVLGRTFALARGVTDVTERVVDRVLVPSSTAAIAFQHGHLLQAGKVDLQLLVGLQEPLRKAALASGAARARADRLPNSLIPIQLLRQRDELVAQVDRLDGALSAASTTVRLAPDMLGRSGPRHYFLAVQNNAEARGTGGLIGAYAVITADHGRLTRDRVGTDRDLPAATHAVVDLGAEYADHYDQYQSRNDWRSAVLTPEWPSAAATIAGLWTSRSHQPLDGVIGIDPHSMASVLAATGPVDAGGQSIGTGNVVDFVMRDEYTVFAKHEDERKQVLSQLAGGIFDKVVSGQASASALVKAFAAAGHNGHLQLWSDHPAEQSALAAGSIGGRLVDAPSALQVVSSNSSGNKLDYYVRRTVGYTRPSRGKGLATVTLLNTVDPATVPPYVNSRVDLYGFQVKQGLDGTTTQLLSVYGGVRAQLFGVKLNGATVPVEFGFERGHPYMTLLVELKPRVPMRIDVSMSDPGGTLVYRQQPLARDDVLDITVPYRAVGRTPEG